ncbi:hypothetical protein AL90_02091, partial [Mycobacterium tuberculosis TKK_04_0064]
PFQELESPDMPGRFTMVHITHFHVPYSVYDFVTQLSVQEGVL